MPGRRRAGGFVDVVVVWAFWGEVDGSGGDVFVGEGAHEDLVGCFRLVGGDWGGYGC